MRRIYFSSCRVLHLAALLLLLTSCKNNASGPEELDPTVEITASKTELWLDDSLQLTATVKFGTGMPIEVAEISWTGNQTDLLEVTAQGLVKAVGTGEATITATCKDVSDTITLSIYSYALVYTSTVNGTYELFYLELSEGATPECIRGISSNTPEGVPSPDGSQIVYVQLNLTTGNYDLFLHNVEEQFRPSHLYRRVRCDARMESRRPVDRLPLVQQPGRSI